MATFQANFTSSGGTFSAAFLSSESLAVDFGEVIEIDRHFEYYDGPYGAVPSAQTQVLLTEDKHMRENVVIQPIPSNYGLITWDGAILTVS